MKKGIECRYPTKQPKNPRPSNVNTDDALNGTRISLPLLAADDIFIEPDKEVNGDDIVNGALAVPDLDFANFGENYFDWTDVNVDLTEGQDEDRVEKVAQPTQITASTSSILVRHSTPLAVQPLQRQQSMPSDSFSIPPQPSYTIRSLVWRSSRTPGAQRTANLILYNLRSFPRMMLRHNSLPPFIHPHLMSSAFMEKHMEPLNNCISLVHMISSGIQGSRKLFWKSVGLECERLCAEHSTLTRWELLAAMQALAIYILIRMDEGEMEYNNFDTLLLVTVAVTSKETACRTPSCPTQSALSGYGLENDWHNWIFDESRRRLGVIYRVLNILVYLEPAALCDLPADLALAPLPTKKQLWEAADEFAWKVESERQPGAHNAFAVAANGDLVLLGGGQLACSSDSLLLHNPPTLDFRTPSRSAANWEEWCSGMDGFGGLVLLAASLIV
ncbi:hypothetical protein K504DRAFT_506642 [Pleomassaria siparia CBS 279.74]|uniref:Transcription factor domain-containing protein n=1 Tax=Pleomassaria siparia CBS 279.74 TaxID=1314801 RepID=A0A6G1JVN1_9PLEO|nr:hypothetical protein K504DRAFT_506642 [Pleomassaria siparia CBS 279.74]